MFFWISICSLKCLSERIFLNLRKLSLKAVFLNRKKNVFCFHDTGRNVLKSVLWNVETFFEIFFGRSVLYPEKWYFEYIGRNVLKSKEMFPWHWKKCSFGGKILKFEEMLWCVIFVIFCSADRRDQMTLYFIIFLVSFWCKTWLDCWFNFNIVM